jgi:hypothetical protein
MSRSPVLSLRVPCSVVAGMAISDRTGSSLLFFRARLWGESRDQPIPGGALRLTPLSYGM